LLCYDIIRLVNKPKTLERFGGNMSKKYLIPCEGEFFKANLHCHTTVSDGRLTPAEIKEAYKAQGYSIVAYTDHRKLVDHRETLGDKDFLPLVGYETDISKQVETKDGKYNKTCHLCAISRDPDNAVFIEKPLEYSKECINDNIEKLRKANYIVNYNHPSWSHETADDYLAYKGLTAMEVYNYGCVAATNDGVTLNEYSVMLRHGMRVFALATDDNHNVGAFPEGNDKGQWDSFGGYTMIKAKSLEYKDIIDALDAGHFYASWGPEIFEYYVDEEKNTLCITTSNAKTIIVKSNRIGSKLMKYDRENGLTHAEFDLSLLNEDDYVVWFEVLDKNNNCAVTNPYWVK